MMMTGDGAAEPTNAVTFLFRHSASTQADTQQCRDGVLGPDTVQLTEEIRSFVASGTFPISLTVKGLPPGFTFFI